MEEPIKDLHKTILAIVGPTATGKTDLAIALAKILKAEIISADSMQVYRFMDIGTAKPPEEIRKAIPHHFIDIRNPDEVYSAGLFARQAHPLITKKQGEKTPLIIVGGTGLYIKALEKGLVELPPIPEDIKSRLWEEYINMGLPVMYERLRKIDPSTASAIYPNDRFRILRAIGIFETTGKPLSSLQKQHGFRHTVLHLMKIGLTFPREILYKRIETRVEQMLKAGWLEEVKRLLAMGYDETIKPMQAIGYKQLTQVLRGKIKLETAIEEVKKETKHLAKRQITWYKKEAPHIWITPKENNLHEVAYAISTHIKRGEKNGYQQKRRKHAGPLSKQG